MLNIYIQVKIGRSKENEIYQNFEFHFHICENTVFIVFRAMGKAPSCVYVHSASTFSIACYDVSAYGNAYT